MGDTQATLIRALELQGQGKTTEAAEGFRAVLAINPGDAASRYSLALMDYQQGSYETALQHSTAGVQAAPGFAPLFFVHGTILQSLGRFDEALQAFDRAIEINPQFTEVLINSGALLRELHRHKEALERFNAVLAIKPDHTGALANCAILLTEFKQSESAINMFKALLAADPEYPFGLGLLLYEQLHICDWSLYEPLKATIIQGVREGKRVCKTLALKAITDDVRDHAAAAKIFSESYCTYPKEKFWQGEIYNHHKIRVAYVSPDLREHPVGHLVAGVIEHHDKSRFELTAISLGIDDGSALRARMLAAFDDFVDGRQMTSLQIAQYLRDQEIDIVIDLAGYTSDSRTSIFSYRPCPASVNWLGYPGTLGNGYMDYILADRHLISETDQVYYDEKVIYLPHTYLPTDGSLQFADRKPSRSDYGLPEGVPVFCSFSHDYKISPDMFSVWMRIMAATPGSVLWLMTRNPQAQQNLRAEAEKRGVQGERLIFATRVPQIEDHLARYSLADLFLDTHPYNAHTTAADAMMGGLPVLTFMGRGFASRVAGSLCHAMGMPELIASSLDDYEQKAIQWVKNPQGLAALKAKLRAQREHAPLFDTARFTRDLEYAYIAMARRSQIHGVRDALSS